MKRMDNAHPISCQILIERTGTMLANRVRVARALSDRMKGLLGRGFLEPDEGLILSSCRSIHTFFMRFAIDAVFVDRVWVVVALWNALPPWRFTPWVRTAQAVIELPAGTAKRVGLVVGDRLIVQAHSQKTA